MKIIVITGRGNMVIWTQHTQNMHQALINQNLKFSIETSFRNEALLRLRFPLQPVLRVMMKTTISENKHFE